MSKLLTEKGFDGMGTLQKSRVHGDNVFASCGSICAAQEAVLDSIGRRMMAHRVSRTIG